jgi:DNA polymerase-3 subunit gamma/tau
MTHIALYRKWRPQNWDDLVGQEHISRTLINAIQTDKVAHAYMFCGSRGTGKTTTARILAKALNCENKVNGSPCNKCPSCEELSSGASLDVIEIDAASNRGIGEIKTLIEQVRFASVGGKYKVYIIDEFHMLTTEAFNAILKTLEEPPPKVVFVLATTEAHKILPTIVSRCQRFDFQRIPVNDLIGRLRYIADEEKIIISDESILSIAKKANGGLRDALSLLDQISAFSLGTGEVSSEIVFQVLGMVSGEYLAKLAEAIAEKEPIKVIATLSELLRAGNDPNVITTETISFFRNLMIVKSAPEMASFLEVPVSSMDIYKKIAEVYTAQDILYCLDALNQISEKIRRTQTAQLWLEVNFVKLCRRGEIEPTNTSTQTSSNQGSNNNETQYLIKKIAELEKKIEYLASRPVQVVESHNYQQHKISKDEHHEDISHHEHKENTQPIINTAPSGHPLSKQYLSGVWDRILHETRKKSIPAAALLSNGFLADINESEGTILVRFENEGFIDLLKRSQKYEKIEQALKVLFEKPYRVIMEKDSIEKKKVSLRESIIHPFNPLTSHHPEEEKKTEPIKSNVQVIDKDIDKTIEHQSISSFESNTNTLIDLNTNISTEKEIKPEIVTNTNNLVEVEKKTDVETIINIQESIEEKEEINADNKIEEPKAEYILASDNQIVTSDIPMHINHESEKSYNEYLQTETEDKTKNKDAYFKDIVEVFKGKIIKKRS